MTGFARRKQVTRNLANMLQRYRRRFFVDAGDYRNTVFLAGTGRSGTTWLENIVNHDNGFRVMYEPFHSVRVPLLKGWRYRQYLSADNRDRRFLEPAARILGGSVRNGWIDQLNGRFIARKRLIKDIRANLILKWIKRHFPEIPIVLLLRHPCAVAQSKVKLGWETHLDEFLLQPDLVNDFLAPVHDAVKGARDVFDRHVVMWCVENWVPLRQFAPGEILVVFYEDLCTRTWQATESVLSFVGRTADPRAMAASTRRARRWR